MVKAVPVIVLDGDIPREPKNSKFFNLKINNSSCNVYWCKKTLAVFTWGRRMSKKFELLRRNDSRKLHDAGTQMVRKSFPSASADMLSVRNASSLRSMPKHSLVTEKSQEPPAIAAAVIAATATTNTSTPTSTSNSVNSSYSFKTFFHRIGSTGMLSRSNNQSNLKQLNDNTRTLYRSSSTSQLNTPSYVKGEYHSAQYTK